MSLLTLAAQGIDFFRVASKLTGTLDQVRKEHIALRTKIQLVSAGEDSDAETGDNSISKVETAIFITKEVLHNLNTALAVLQPCFAPERDHSQRIQGRVSQIGAGEKIEVMPEEELREMERYHGRHVAVLQPGIRNIRTIKLLSYIIGLLWCSRGVIMHRICRSNVWGGCVCNGAGDDVARSSIRWACG